MSGTTTSTDTTTAAAGPGEPQWVKPSIGIYNFTLFAAGLAVSVVTKNDAAQNMLIGAIIAMGNTVISYYFGSSSGSAKKTELLGAAASPQPWSATGLPTPSVVHTETVQSSTATPVPTLAPTPRPTPTPTPGPLTPLKQGDPP